LLPLIKRLRQARGYDRYSAETIDRLLWSMHVDDLRWVAQIILWLVIATIIFLVFVIFAKQQTALVSLITVVGVIIAGLGTIIAWCYRVGSSRLGIVDLFACEIATLCRICTITGLAQSCIQSSELEATDQSPTPDKTRKLRSRFSSFDFVESYTPIFDGNAKELQNLKIRVVTNITAFYTYWKAMRDALRKLASVPVAGVDASLGIETDPWDQAMRNVVYMHFLACESARKAIRDLVEFLPNRAENTITILLSELPAYGFLLKRIPENDVRRARLELRKERYRVVVPEIYYLTRKQHFLYGHPEKVRSRIKYLLQTDAEELSRDWDKASKMLGQLVKDYEDALGEKFPPYARKASSKNLSIWSVVRHQMKRLLPARLSRQPVVPARAL
jgi:hypothetical protein